MECVVFACALELSEICDSSTVLFAAMTHEPTAINSAVFYDGELHQATNYRLDSEST